MDIRTAKAIPIDEFLQRLGYEVAKTVSSCKWYQSPTRIEKTPSFKLTPDATGWFDHGTGEGGNILDLAYRLKTGLPAAKLDGGQVKAALAFIENVVGATPSFELPPVRPSLLGTFQAPAYNVIRHQPFNAHGRSSSLSKAALYLGSRGINAERVAPYLEEVTYAGSDGQERYGFGMPNVSGGFELRRHGDWVKTAVGRKDVTIFRAARAVAPWHAFYSMIDFCTFLTVDKPPVDAYNYLIINSDSLVGKAMAYLEGLPAGFMVHYPHDDLAPIRRANPALAATMRNSGLEAYHRLLDFLSAHGWSGSDKLYLYTGFKDWTEAREQQLGLQRL